jgi:Zn finger protein HypA/HybF involved in hydrogenase expression
MGPTSRASAIIKTKRRPVTCKNCKVAMTELKGHIYHKKRKWRCPKCKRVRMQEHKPR